MQHRDFTFLPSGKTFSSGLKSEIACLQTKSNYDNSAVAVRSATCERLVGFSFHSRIIIIPVAFTRAAAVCPGLRFISRADCAVIIEVICCLPIKMTTSAKTPLICTLPILPINWFLPLRRRITSLRSRVVVGRGRNSSRSTSLCGIRCCPPAVRMLRIFFL